MTAVITDLSLFRGLKELLQVCVTYRRCNHQNVSYVGNHVMSYLVTARKTLKRCNCNSYKDSIVASRIIIESEQLRHSGCRMHARDRGSGLMHGYLNCFIILLRAHFEFHE